ncbi:hypothetical protein BO86DRAFT_403233 [Aspergillus japonicus CBS 114.51]|uniref:Uncharacterized protein n=1 Tax=Aspergillus japonicus CBS 114.51 TaxID=1448312 RepID=A0A8T8WQ82_ASPJA|nr:hypothetical protein BO86DRAFT_403233 [Aspergillus japonicus CBS 114.51]RAH77941.1 hypothetical protein BO86DRAFT_403233 [Aspergillus japonicus CBS 114.51]
MSFGYGVAICMQPRHLSAALKVTMVDMDVAGSLRQNNLHLSATVGNPRPAPPCAGMANMGELEKIEPAPSDGVNPAEQDCLGGPERRGDSSIHCYRCWGATMMANVQPIALMKYWRLNVKSEIEGSKIKDYKDLGDLDAVAKIKELERTTGRWIAEQQNIFNACSEALAATLREKAPNVTAGYYY